MSVRIFIVFCCEKDEVLLKPIRRRTGFNRKTVYFESIDH